MFIFPYNNLLSIDLIGINESDLKTEELYEDNFYNFFNDYERNNPITKKEGIKHFLDKLLEKVLITKNDYDTILENYEHMNLLEIYYKSKLHFGYNLLKRAFFNTNFKKRKEKNNLDFNKIKNEPHNMADKTDKINPKESEDKKEDQSKVNILRRNNTKFSSSNNQLFLNQSENQKINIIKKKKIKKVIKIKKQNQQGKKKLILRKDSLNPNINSKNELILSKRNTIEKEENNNDNSNLNFNSKKKILK